MIRKVYQKIRTYGWRKTAAIIRALVRQKCERFAIRLAILLEGNNELEDIIILEGHNDFDSNAGALYEYLLCNGFNKKYRLVWFLRNQVPEDLPYHVEGYTMGVLSWKRIKSWVKAKYIFTCHEMIQTVRQGQVSCYLSHGSLGLKDARGKITIPQNISYYLCPSDRIGGLVAEQYMLDYPNPRQLVLGMPMLDVFYQPGNGDLNKVTKRKYDKVILWMPTFRHTVSDRVDSTHEYPLGVPLLRNSDDYIHLNNFMRESNSLLIVKIHPMQAMDDIKIKELSNITILDGISVKQKGIDNYRLMKDVDALISDYSSVVTDFLHADKPIAYAIDDLKDYSAGFIIPDPTRLMAGHKLLNFDELLAFLQDVIEERDVYRAERARLLNYIFEYKDGRACERIVRFFGISDETEMSRL